MELTLETPVEKLPFVGKVYGQRLAKLDIKTAFDLLHHYPFRYNDFSVISKISSLQAGETFTIQGQIMDIQNVFTKHGKRIQKAKISDETGAIDVVWYNQPFLVKNLPKGSMVSLSGKVGFFGNKRVFESPEYELLRVNSQQPTANSQLNDNFQQLTTIHTARLVPVYPETYGISSKWLRNRIYFLLKQELHKEEEDFLPAEIRFQNNLLDLPLALAQIHFPKNKNQADEAKTRLAFDELFLIKLNSLLRKQEWEKDKTTNKLHVTCYMLHVNNFISSLPFNLTDAQKRCLNEIFSDFGKDQPMNRLLQGDVGSGKTVVAAIIIYLTYLNGFQSAFMAPTEILAMQHFKTLQKILTPFGVKLSLVTSSSKININQAHVYIGTHALLSQKMKMDNLGLAVIDEQHRFGVEQRGELLKKGFNPHLLTMTATPIPRSVALTLYGELDLSYIDEMPKNRKRVQTWLVSEEKRENAYRWTAKTLQEQKGQAYIICPLIEESEIETMQTVKAAKAEFKRLQNQVFPNFKLALLHGKIKAREKEAVLDQFRKGEAEILVSTPIVEVGIDNPNATIMIIETAGRFGLAQLHQLRGRVGRGEKQSYCLLFSENQTESSYKRLKSLESIYNGAKLAEIDLGFRGPGAIFGTAQHGFLKLKIASLSDYEMIKKVKEAIELVINNKKMLAFVLESKKIKKEAAKNIPAN